MNERIRELADEAAEFIEAGSGSWTSDIFEQKFAELIVRECGAALSPMLRDMVSRGQAFDLIKQHFGIEE